MLRQEPSDVGQMILPNSTAVCARTLRTGNLIWRNTIATVSTAGFVFSFVLCLLWRPHKSLSVRHRRVRHGLLAACRDHEAARRGAQASRRIRGLVEGTATLPIRAPAAECQERDVVPGARIPASRALAPCIQCPQRRSSYDGAIRVIACTLTHEVP
jgi:hypothetical protein